METYWARKQQKLNNTKSCIYYWNWYIVFRFGSAKFTDLIDIQVGRTAFNFFHVFKMKMFGLIYDNAKNRRTEWKQLNWIQYYAYAPFSPTSMKNWMQFILLMPKHTNYPSHIFILSWRLPRLVFDIFKMFSFFSLLLGLVAFGFEWQGNETIKVFGFFWNVHFSINERP